MLAEQSLMITRDLEVFDKIIMKIIVVQTGNFNNVF